MGTTETEAGIAASSDFKHSFTLEKGKINQAIAGQDRIFVSTAQPRGFAVVSTEGEGKIIAQYEERKILGGMFAGVGDAIYAPLQNKLYKLDANGATELLTDHQAELFGVKDVMLCGEDLLVLTHNGLYVFDQDSLALKTSFKNEGKAVSPIKILIDKASNRLFIANLRDEADSMSIVLAVDLANDYETIWKTKLEGSLSASAGTSPAGRLQMASGMLISPIKAAVSASQELIFHDAATGEQKGKVAVHSNRNLYSDGRFVYVLHYDSESAAAIDPTTFSTVWISSIETSAKGPFRRYGDKLYAFAAGKKIVSIDMKSGAAALASEKVNFQNTIAEDLGQDLSRFVIDGKKICWD